MNAEVTARLRELQTTIEAGAGSRRSQLSTQGRLGALAYCTAPALDSDPWLSVKRRPRLSQLPKQAWRDVRHWVIRRIWLAYFVTC